MGLFFHNDTFIKIKPTVLYCLFSAALFFGLAFRRPMLEIMFDGALHLTPAGWRILTWRWAFFFLFLAVLNEYVWRHYSESAWVTFKSFGFMPLTVVVRARADAGDYEAREQRRRRRRSRSSRRIGGRR